MSITCSGLLFHFFFKLVFRSRVLLGLNSHTTAENVTQAAYEATGFQIHEILEAFKADTPFWNWRNKKETLLVCGQFAENNNFVQFISDVLGILLERPQTPSPSGVGAMIAAGITCKVLTLKYAKVMYRPPSDAFMPTTTSKRECNSMDKKEEWTASLFIGWCFCFRALFVVQTVEIRCA